MSTVASTSGPLDVFSAIDAQLGMGDNNYVDTIDTATITDDEEKGVQSILQGAAPNNIDVSKDNPAGGTQSTDQDNYPEFFQAFKDILNQPYVLPEDDKTDYALKSVTEFGTGFGHINTRDAFFEETFQRNARQEYLDSNGDSYARLLDLEEGRIDKAQLLRQNIYNSLKQQADAKFQDFNDEDYQAALSKFFEDGGKGKPTPAGEARINELTRTYLGHLNNIRAQADQHAKSELNSYRTNQAALTSEVERFSLGGLQLGPELGAHVTNFIRSGKLDAWKDADNLSPQEEAVRALKMAIVADDKALLSFLSKFVKASVHHGVSTVARQKF